MEPQKRPLKKILIFPVQWDYKNFYKDIWNPNEPRVFPPKRFGIGWGLNFHALLTKARVIKPR